ncbi:beta-propeller fold lactonase family protein [Cysteiniphilum sp. JM-1]|uniref:beta-propeller fold lactonase family protein n=1 Tax=Cysteiniphilum sp. JM-1 TaxID=2610891 RepID=UPI001243B453|nr:beta-propeller fold lactonase family protein [Cysteiniphilum sp. JM-1]
MKKRFILMFTLCCMMLFSGCGRGGDGTSGKSNANNGGQSQELDLAMPQFVNRSNSAVGTLELKELSGVGKDKDYSLIITDSVSGAQCAKPMALTYNKSIIANEVYTIGLVAPDEGPCQHKLTFNVSGTVLGSSTVNVGDPVIEGEVVTGLPDYTHEVVSYPVEFKFKNVSSSYSAIGVSISQAPSDFTEISNTCKGSQTIPANGTCVIQGSFASNVGKNAVLSYTLSYSERHEVIVSTKTVVLPKLFSISLDGMIKHFDLDENRSLINGNLSFGLVFPTSMSFSGDGKKIFVTNRTANMVSRCDINTATDKVSNCTDVGVVGLNDPDAISLIADGKIAFISNLADNTITRCNVDSVGDFSNCTIAGNTFDKPESIKFTADGKMVFVVNHGNDTISCCNVDAVGDFSHCRTVLSGLSGLGKLALAADGRKAFIINSSKHSHIAHCDVDPQGVFSGCVDSGATGLVTPLKLTLTADGKHVYVIDSNKDDQITHCDLNSAGDFSHCISAAGAKFVQPADMLFSADGKRVIVLGSVNNSFSSCNVDMTTGLFSDCMIVGGTGFSIPFGITLRADGKKVFVTNSVLNEVSSCDVDMTTGLFANCKVFDNTNFDKPYGITLTADGKHAFIANADGSSVTSCDVDAEGNFSNCRDSGGTGFTNPYGITLMSDGKKIFVTNQDNDSVSHCDVNAKGDLSNCSNAGGSNIATPSAIVFTADGKMAFISNLAGNISQCNVDTNGDFSSCKINPEASKVIGPTSMALTSDDKTIFVNDYFTSTITRCDVDTKGDFSNCRDFNARKNDSHGVFFSSAITLR